MAWWYHPGLAASVPRGCPVVDPRDSSAFAFGEWTLLARARWNLRVFPGRCSVVVVVVAAAAMVLVATETREAWHRTGAASVSVVSFVPQSRHSARFGESVHCPAWSKMVAMVVSWRGRMKKTVLWILRETPKNGLARQQLAAESNPSTPVRPLFHEAPLRVVRTLAQTRSQASVGGPVGGCPRRRQRSVGPSIPVRRQLSRRLCPSVVRHCDVIDRVSTNKEAVHVASMWQLSLVSPIPFYARSFLSCFVCWNLVASSGDLCDHFPRAICPAYGRAEENEQHPSSLYTYQSERCTGSALGLGSGQRK
jgi:hypothetical protein